MQVENITIMFYFADEDWREEWGGDTLFYSFKSKKCEKIWKKKKWYFKNNVPIESLDEFYELFEENLKGYFKPNSIGGMCANEYSYHAVNPINIDESRKRKSVRLCLELNKPYPLPIQLTNKIKIILIKLPKFKKINNLKMQKLKYIKKKKTYFLDKEYFECTRIYKIKKEQFWFSNQFKKKGNTLAIMALINGLLKIFSKKIWLFYRVRSVYRCKRAIHSF